MKETLISGTIVSSVESRMKCTPEYRCFILEADRETGEKEPSTFLIKFFGNDSSKLRKLNKRKREIDLYGARVIVRCEISCRASSKLADPDGIRSFKNEEVEFKGKDIVIVSYQSMEG